MLIVEAGREQLNDFVLKNGGPFQQSWQWGELQERMNRPVKRFLVYENDEAIAAALFVRHDLPLRKFYWLCPRGPILGENFQILAEKLGGIFIRVEPELPSSYHLQPTTYNLVKAPKDHSPRATVLIDLTKTQSELLAGIHPKTRYNIRLAEKKGLQVEIPNSKFQIPNFFELLEKTAKRGGFHLHPKKYYEEMLKLDEVKLFGANYQGKLLAAAMVSFWGNTAAYLHGASDYDSRNLMAPYLLHWQIIKYAKDKGMKYYDFGGVAPRGQPDHPLQGVTRFKQGFGGAYAEIAGSWDCVLDPVWYRIYKLARRVL